METNRGGSQIMSGKPVAERLQVKRGRSLAVIGAPGGMDDAIGAGGARASAGEADVVLLFVGDRTGFETALPGLLPDIRGDAILWLAYPKLTSPLAGDLNRDLIRAAVLGYGLTTVSQIAIDEDWSALRLKQAG
jgi:hypothetical protein